jgi:acetyltransferase
MQCGVIRARSIEEMFVFASALATQPAPKGSRIAIVTNSGGPGILAADACVQLGLDVPPLEPATQARMRAVVAAEASVVNPVDMIASARGEQYERCIRAVMEDPAVDGVIVIFTSLESIDSMKVAEGIMRGGEDVEKPLLVCFMGKVASKPAIQRMKAAGLPVYTFPEEAAHAMWTLARYRQWLDRPEGHVATFDDSTRRRLRRSSVPRPLRGGAISPLPNRSSCSRRPASGCPRGAPCATPARLARRRTPSAIRSR